MGIKKEKSLNAKTLAEVEFEYNGTWTCHGVQIAPRSMVPSCFAKLVLAIFFKRSQTRNLVTFSGLTDRS